MACIFLSTIIFPHSLAMISPSVAVFIKSVLESPHCADKRKHFNSQILVLYRFVLGILYSDCHIALSDAVILCVWIVGCQLISVIFAGVYWLFTG